jgi:hypothetical protein
VAECVALHGFIWWQALGVKKNRKTVNVPLQATEEIHQYLHYEVAVSVFSVGRISTSQVYENLK